MDGCFGGECSMPGAFGQSPFLGAQLNGFQPFGNSFAQPSFNFASGFPGGFGSQFPSQFPF
jgi:hypothetical protein